MYKGDKLGCHGNLEPVQNSPFCGTERVFHRVFALPVFSDYFIILIFCLFKDFINIYNVVTLPKMPRYV